MEALSISDNGKRFLLLLIYTLASLKVIQKNFPELLFIKHYRQVEKIMWWDESPHEGKVPRPSWIQTLIAKSLPGISKFKSEEDYIARDNS